MNNWKVSNGVLHVKGGARRIESYMYMLHTRDDNALFVDRDYVNPMLLSEQRLRTYDELFDDKFNLIKTSDNIDYMERLYYELYHANFIGSNLYNRYKVMLREVGNSKGYKTAVFDILMEATLEAFKHYNISMDDYMVLLNVQQTMSNIFKCGYAVMNFQGSHYKGLNFYIVDGLDTIKHIVKVVNKDLNNMVSNEALSQSVSDYVFDKIYDYFLGEGGNLDVLHDARLKMSYSADSNALDTKHNLFGDKFNINVGRSDKKVSITTLLVYCVKTRNNEMYSFTKINGKVVNLKKDSTLDTLDKDDVKYITTRNELIFYLLNGNFYRQELKLFNSIQDLKDTTSNGNDLYVDWTTLDVDNLTRRYMKLNTGNKVFYMSPTITQSGETYSIRDDIDDISITTLEYEKLTDDEVAGLTSFHKIITKYYKEGVFSRQAKIKTEVYRFLRKLKTIIERKDKVFELGDMEFFECIYTKETFIHSWAFPGVLTTVFRFANTDDGKGYYKMEKTREILKKSNIVTHEVKDIGNIYVKKDKVGILEQNLSKVNNAELSKYNVEVQSRMNEYTYSPNKAVAIVKDDDNVFKVEKLYEVDKSKLLYGVELEFDKYDESNINEELALNDRDKTIAISNHLLTQGLPSVYTTRDGSLRNGFETKTVPVEYGLLFNEQLFDWDAYFDFILKNGYTGENNTCGLHVHISKSHYLKPNLSYEEQVEILLAMFSIILTNNKEYLIRFSRRNYSNIERWAKFNTKIDDDLKLSNAIKPDSSVVVLSRYIDRINQNYRNDRYTALNVRKSPTFEFRIFRGVNDKDTLFSTLKLVNIIAQKVKDIWDRLVEATKENDVEKQVSIFLELDNINLESEMNK